MNRHDDAAAQIHVEAGLREKIEAHGAALNASAAASLRERVEWRVVCALEPFLVPDVTPSGESFTEVFHILRDMVDDGSLVHGGDGYRKPA